MLTFRSIISLFLASTSFFNASISATGGDAAASFFADASVFSAGLVSAASEYHLGDSRVLSGGAADREIGKADGRLKDENDFCNCILGARMLDFDAWSMVRDNMVLGCEVVGLIFVRCRTFKKF